MRPLRALLEPLWVTALLVLLINDHVLKPFADDPRWLIGKVSDLAGMIVLPPIAATLLRVRSARALRLVYGLVGVGFTLIKTVPAASALYDALMWPIDGHNVVDPTDLVALAMLPLGIKVLGPAMWLPVPARRAHRVALIAGAMSCIATAAQIVPRPCPAGSVRPRDVASDSPCHRAFSAPLFVGNHGTSTVTVQIRTAREPDRAQLCEKLPITEDAVCAMADLFGPPRSLTLRPGENLPVEHAGDGDCTVALVRTGVGDWRPWLLAHVRSDAASDDDPTALVAYSDSGLSFTRRLPPGVLVDDDGASLSDTGGVELWPVLCAEAP